jgi:predicted ATPase
VIIWINGGFGAGKTTLVILSAVRAGTVTTAPITV